MNTRGMLATFFKTVLKDETGFICIATIDRALPEKDPNAYKERFYEVPGEFEELLTLVVASSSLDIYFCPQLLSSRKRDKEHVKTCTTAWADLDSCNPENLLVTPSLTIRSSDERWQAFWIFNEAQEPAAAEELSRRIAYYHRAQGADSSGWDLSQLLRVPYTNNFKYTPPHRVAIVGTGPMAFELKDFVAYPEVTSTARGRLPMPELLPGDPLELIQQYRHAINPISFKLYSEVPDKQDDNGRVTWSETLWKLLLLLFEAGMTREEVFTVANGAACNKYARDRRPIENLWNDVVRAYFKHQEDINTTIIPELVNQPLLSEEELELARSRTTFVERYIQWASGLGDAAVAYHEAGAFVVLASLLAGRVRLPTSFGLVVPNLWFMILADTTLTRKSTAMDIAMDLVDEVDQEVLLATDGSMEGLLQGLSTRPGKPSVFLKDEFSGLLEAMTKKDYMAGVAEMLTKLYDGKTQKRLLKKDPIEIRDPVLILFAGGIKTRVQSLVSLEQVSSGFLPRFVFLTAESDVKKVKPMGPPTVRDTKGKDDLLKAMNRMYGHYHTSNEMTVKATGFKIQVAKKWNASLTPQAWARYNKFEAEMLQAGVTSDRPEIMTPVYDRLAKSALRAAILIAASDRLDEEVVVEEGDLVQAIYYCQRWREHAVNIINGVGHSVLERDIDRIYNIIKARKAMSRSALMQSYHLTARQADVIFTTLEQRGLIMATRMGRQTMYHVLGAGNDISTDGS